MSKSRVKKPRVYTGDLAEPIYEPIHAAVAAGDEDDPIRYRKLQKLLKLLEFYEIDAHAKHKWAQLALALAERHVPGLRVEHGVRPKRGRRKTWKAGLAIYLLNDVHSLLSKRNMTTKDAINELHADRSKGWHRYTKENLIARHREARREQKGHHRLASELSKSRLIAGVGARQIPRSGLIAGFAQIPSTDEK